MKQAMYGTVSALALLLALQGAARADATLATSVNNTIVNAAEVVLVDAENSIDDLAFFAASGAFQVQQNNSINSAASQNAAIDARVEDNQTDITLQANTALSSNLNFANLAADAEVVSVNLIDGAAFEFAAGQFQVQQSNGINSTTGQNVAISAITDSNGFIAADQLSVAAMSNDVTVNTAIGTAVIALNAITGDAFAAAAGSFQVQQNNSINSSAQQNAAISAINDPGGTISVLQASEADLETTVAGNVAIGATVAATNTINGAAFFAASGQFQVQQNNSINSAASQNMAISATTTR